MLFFMGSDTQKTDMWGIPFDLYEKRRNALYRYGFRMVDVSHNPLDLKAGGRKEMVDMELVLHVLRRSMLPPYPQEIILVANDQGYIPLLYRLWADGHHVELWAHKPAEAFWELAKYTKEVGGNGIAVKEFGPTKPSSKSQSSSTEAKAFAMPVASPPPVVSSTSSPHLDPTERKAVLEAVLREDDLPSAAVSEVLANGIRQTLQIVSDLPASDRTPEAVQREIRKAQGMPINRLGYQSAHPLKSVKYWLAHLRAAGALHDIQTSSSLDHRATAAYDLGRDSA
ncbi:MAG TPA: NYN domain-containing protein, partial [Ktedonobacterales bacterium]|nr:NYN domain-containing protein [Ktedonobacterales bacterium]